MRWLGALALIAAVAAGTACGKSNERYALTERNLETPRFAPPPPPQDVGTTLNQLSEHLASPAGESLLLQLVPAQAGALWIGLLTVVMIALDLRRPLHPRNIELLALLPIGFLMFEVMEFFELFHDSTYWQLMDWVFIGIMSVSLFLLVRAIIRMRAIHAEPWQPNLPRQTLMVVALLLLALNVAAGLLRQPDDVGFYSNLGAQRLRERAMFPYGDPLLTNTPGATYSPIFYLTHLVYQLVLVPEPLNPPVDRPVIGEYILPPILASQLATVTLHVLGVIALFIAARRLLGEHRAWAVVALYCGSSYVMGVGGDREMINGITFMSHIGPAAVTMMAFAALPVPWLSGFLLAMAVWTLFYPAFFIPAWTGFYFRDRRALVTFIAGLAIGGSLIGIPVLLRSEPIEGRGIISTVMHETQGHQQDPNAYGSSPFGFWGQRGGIRAVLREPLIAGQPNSSPAFLIYALFVLASFFLARGRTELQLSLLIGALAIGTQLWKIHTTGMYVTWYLGFLLIGFLGHQIGTANARLPKQDGKTQAIPTS